MGIKAGKNASVAMGKSINLGVSASGGSKLIFSSSNTKVATVSSAGVAKSVNVGTAVISVKAAETTNYSAINESVNLKVTQGTQSLSFANQSKKVTYSKVKKAKQTVAITKAKNAKTKVSYSITKAVKGKKKVKYFTIASSTGKITVKKGTPKGTYKVTVKAAAKQTANWKAANKSAVITIKVK